MGSWLGFAPVAAFLLSCALGLLVLARGVRTRRRVSAGAAAPPVPWAIAGLRSPWTGAFWLLFGFIGLVLWRPAIGWQAESSGYWTDGGVPALGEVVRGEIANWAREERPVGVAVGIVTPDGTARATLGRARLLGGAPLREATFEIGSITKTFTGVLLASLVNRASSAWTTGCRSCFLPASTCRRSSSRSPSLTSPRIPRGSPGHRRAWAAPACSCASCSA